MLKAAFREYRAFKSFTDGAFEPLEGTVMRPLPRKEGYSTV